MNINIYLEDSLAKQLNYFAKQSHLSRNAIIREALREWVQHRTTEKWPASVLRFNGYSEIPAFESTRSELKEPKDNPLE